LCKCIGGTEKTKFTRRPEPAGCNNKKERTVLPPLNEFGYLPPGIHHSTIKELTVRFGVGSPEREVETQELLDFMAWACRAGIQRVIVNGSYVTAKAAPNDIDIVALPGPEYPREEPAYTQVTSQWPFLQVFIAVDEADLEDWALKDFGTDRNRLAKGVVEIQL
jgi:hypothetical protein